MSHLWLHYHSHRWWVTYRDNYCIVINLVCNNRDSWQYKKYFISHITKKLIMTKVDYTIKEFTHMNYHTQSIFCNRLIWQFGRLFATITKLNHYQHPFNAHRHTVCRHLCAYWYGMCEVCIDCCCKRVCTCNHTSKQWRHHLYMGTWTLYRWCW